MKQCRYRIAWIMDDNSPFEFVVGNRYTLKSAESQVNDANQQAGKKVAFVVSEDTVSKRRNHYTPHWMRGKGQDAGTNRD